MSVCDHCQIDWARAIECMQDRGPFRWLKIKWGPLRIMSTARVKFFFFLFFYSNLTSVVLIVKRHEAALSQLADTRIRPIIFFWSLNLLEAVLENHHFRGMLCHSKEHARNQSYHWLLRRAWFTSITGVLNSNADHCKTCKCPLLFLKGQRHIGRKKLIIFTNFP